jgi:hypothetical protein
VSADISKKTIQNRVTKGHLTTHHGAKSPLQDVEHALVALCIQMGKIRLHIPVPNPLVVLCMVAIQSRRRLLETKPVTK